MTVLPVVERELRVASRRRSAFWTRLTAATVAVLIGGGALWFQGEWPAGAAVGVELFQVLASVAFLFCLVSGPVFTADVLSEERREGTLGLLFLTDLRGYDVVAGKLVAASVTATFSLLATLPVLAIPILLGGVSLGEFGRVALALGNALFVSLASGVLVSAASENARSAFALTGFLLFLGFFVLPWLGEALRAAGANAAGAALVAGFSPASAFLWVVSKAPRTGSFWQALVASHAVAWVYLALAARITARIWHEQVRQARVQRWRAIWLDWSFGDATRRQRLRARLLGRNPILWLGSRHRLKRRLLWGCVAVAVGGWLLWRVLAAGAADTWGSTFFIAWFLQAPLKWLMASEASQRWMVERQSGGLELLLTTPLTVQEILRGHWLACRRLFGVPAAAILGAEAVFLAGGLTVNVQDRDMAALTLAGGGIFLWDLYALAWVGLWLGLVKPRPNQAFTGAIVRVLVLPWLAFFLCLFVLGDSGGWVGMLGLWITVCGGCNLLWQRWAQQNLRESLREIAATWFAENRRAGSGV